MFQTKLLSEYQEAFLLHVLLMTHRITFNKQYEEIPCNREVSHERQEEIRQIECLFAKNELPVNHAEISALLNYLEQPRKRMELAMEAQEIIRQSAEPEKLQSIIKQTSARLAEAQIEPTELQWTILINHLNEMLNRSREGTTLAGVDRTLFTELTPETLKIAEETTEAIGQLSEDEWYVLAVHFEVAKQNN